MVQDWVVVLDLSSWMMLLFPLLIKARSTSIMQGTTICMARRAMHRRPTSAQPPRRLRVPAQLLLLVRPGRLPLRPSRGLLRRPATSAFRLQHRPTTPPHHLRRQSQASLHASCVAFVIQRNVPMAPLLGIPLGQLLSMILLSLSHAATMMLSHRHIGARQWRLSTQLFSTIKHGG